MLYRNYILVKHASVGDVQTEDDKESIDRMGSIRNAEVEIKIRQNAFEKALYELTETVDNLKNSISKEEVEKVVEYITNAQEVMANVEGFLMKLEINKQQLLTQEPTRSEVRSTSQRANVPVAELPRLPLPEFSGKAWQWDSFWELFDATVHSLPISDLQKFNYLLRALRGEERASISRFQVTSANYAVVVTFLKEKYGNVQNIVTSLHQQLERWSAKSSQLKDQRKLFDQLSAITTQLQSKGENLESPWLLSKLLYKFTESIQRRTLKEKVSLPQGEAWTMKKLMTTLDTIIKQEEEIEKCMPKRKEFSRGVIESSQKSALASKGRSPFCFYCDNSEHWSTECSKVANPKARLEFLKKSNRCIGCGSKRHTFIECKSKGCMRCGKKHHTSVCFQTPQNQQNTERIVSQRDERTLPQNSAHGKKDNRKRATRAQQNFTMCENEDSTEDEVPDLTVMRVGEISENQTEQVFLLTGSLHTVHPRTQERIRIHVLLDTGADRSFIDANLAKELELPENDVVTMRLHTFGAKSPKEIRCIDTSLRVWDSTGAQHNLHVYTHDDLTKTHCKGYLEERDLQFIRDKHIALSTPLQDKVKPPEILLGCDQLWNFINFEKENYVLPSGLILVPTLLGYMISGKRLSNTKNETKNMDSLVHTIESHQYLDHLGQWEHHWAIQPHDVEKEYCGPEKEEKALINAQVLKDFNNTIERRDQGYVVRLPFKKDHEWLPDNRALALHRLKGILHKYKDKPELLQQYHGVFQDQLNKKVLEVVDESKKNMSKQKHYLPHQPVITPEKDTTKFRVVFDASAHYKDCPSLNDVVHQGPTMLPKLFGILLRFRTGKNVLLSDVEKAFLQVHLHEDDRDFTRCLWLKDISKPLTEDNLMVFRFTRVTFGINASPFLLSATILYHLNNHVENKRLAQEIASNLYVDNLFVNADSVAEGIQKYEELKKIFSDLQMNLRAFISNNVDITKAIKPEDQSSNFSPKVLGLPWNSSTDTFSVDVKITPEGLTSKRTVAQQIASVYDPFGWLIPLLVKAKHFQQKLWKEKYSWDEPLSQPLQKEWHCILNNINGFHKNIRRRISQRATSHSLITYCDASGIAMTACTYLATESNCDFLMAKSKVADYKRPTTVPKMEMNALAIGMRLTINTYLSLRDAIHINRVILLSDSEIALGWIQSSLHRPGVGPYVRNRVKEVHNIVKELDELNVKVQFGYIDTTKNPADIGTRGASAEELSSHIWWKAYSLQSINEHDTISSLFRIAVQDKVFEEEEKLTASTVTATTTKTEPSKDLLDLSRYSSKKKVLRILAYVIRFIRNVTVRLREALRNKLQRHLTDLHPPSQGHLTASEIEDAHAVLIKNHQSVYLQQQYKKQLSKNLNLKEDEKRLLRAYGRLNKSDLSEEAKNPLLVLPHTNLCRLIIEEAHGKYHNSVAHTIMKVRTRYWIPRLREQVKKCIRACVPCQKMNNLPYKYPNMTDLPACRVTRCQAFHHTGLDYFGPIPVYGDNMERMEVHGCIFTCSVTRLIHLEVVSDGTTENFLNAFRRFVARRGKPQQVICDNAPTFILGSEIMNEALSGNPPMSFNEELHREMSNLLIEWKHITPHSPWKGGFYERLIKSVKHALYKTIEKQVLTKEKLQTYLTEIEACINSRPLTYQESELKDVLSPLRPIDFIQRGINLEMPLEISEEECSDPTFLPPSEALQLATKTQAQKALQSSYNLTERYWKCWREQYLTALREQHRQSIDKKRGCIKKIEEGQVVLLVDPSSKKIHWKLARIAKLIKSQDGEVREAEVTSNRKTLRRSVNQLVPLEIQGNSCKVDSNLPETSQKRKSPSGERAVPRYNLRPRKLNTHHSEAHSPVYSFSSSKNTRIWPFPLHMKMALMLTTYVIIMGAILSQN